jgi:putative oxidoreductase
MTKDDGHHDDQGQGRGCNAGAEGALTSRAAQPMVEGAPPRRRPGKGAPIATATYTSSRNMTIVLWVMRVLMAALFLYAAFAKLTSQPKMVEGFALLPVGQWFRYVVGLMEVVGGVAVLVPAFSGLGALLLLVVDVGAFFAQIMFLHEDWIHTIVIGAILAALVYLQRDSIRAQLGM